MEKNMRELFYKDVYEDLINQFSELSYIEKNALLVYKTRLGLLMNDLDNNPDFLYYYNRYKMIYDNPLNATVKYTVFRFINMESLESFITSIHELKDILDGVTSKLITSDDMIVYRAVSSDKTINNISKGNIISSTLSFVEVDKYAKGGDSIAIYEIRIPAGSPVAISPYRVLDDSFNNRLLVKATNDEEEIILNSDNYEFENVETYPGKITFNVYQARKKDEKTRS